MSDVADLTGSRHSSRPSSPPRKDLSAKVSSPVVPLAPLEFLQNQRRGSITDPSLHAASSIAAHKQTIFRQTSESVSLNDPRPPPHYVFGDATSENMQMRKLLHSPSINHDSSFSTILSRSIAPITENSSAAGSSQEKDQSMKESVNFDYNMRRHSIAAGALPLSHGTKRKISTSAVADADTQLVGPGMPSMDVDSEAPAPKRRGSAFDTQRIAQLSLNDRRNSADSRSNWWLENKRRPSLHGSASGTELSGRSGSFPWQSNPAPMDSAPDAATSSASRTYEPSLPTIPPVNFTSERTTSVSDPLGSTGPRSLRSRSRPPSRQMRVPDSSTTQSTPSTGQDDTAAGPSAISAPVQPLASKATKDLGATPYSRSPELRISHKLAERKRRKEMKDLFDELRDHLPADRGMKASKWEILSKAIDFVQNLKQSQQEMSREIEMLRHELEVVRQNSIPGFANSHPAPHVVYTQGALPQPFPIVAPGSVAPPPSRPASSQNVFSPAPNGSIGRGEPPP